ncbi:MAG: sulfopyruvate decarboxylase subunit alpha [Desulfobacteraceae bacterium]|nr:MAG: sulfopyruvate decarboxylase subunit alpha [Desulfobacteraceae bacterium]
MNAEEFLVLLESKGFNFFTGVPCSYLGPLCRLLDLKNIRQHVPAVREDLALGIAAGAYLAGKLPVVYMQNSGLGYCLEAFLSLQLIYRIPALILVSYRGPADQGWEEHFFMGAHTEELLTVFQGAYSIFEKRVSEADIEKIWTYLLNEKKPYFLLVPKGALT